MRLAFDHLSSHLIPAVWLTSKLAARVGDAKSHDPGPLALDGLNMPTE
jgi:hypothetical protein